MRRHDAAVVAFLAAVPLVACGSGDDDPASSESGTPATAAASGNDAGDAGGVDAPVVEDSPAAQGSDRPGSVRDSYPVPFPSGWAVDIQGEIGMTDTSGAQLLYPSEMYDGIVAFYDEWFESQPDEFARTVSGGQIFYQLLGETLYQVSITPDHAERDDTWVLLQVFGDIDVN